MTIVILMIVSQSSAMPAKLSDDIIDNLKSGYYYIDNGVITRVKSDPLRSTLPPGRRRQDSQDSSAVSSNLPSGVKFTPLVRYKQTKTNRKKLFVPNLFG
ncbi:uncharacterized protein LOC142239255 isoform X2 [Haematobia irritans]